jgi:uncharacterized protein
MARTDDGWVLTYTGRRFWPLDPRSCEFSVEDWAHALANKCRFGGHCREFYSVAQHSVLVSRDLPDELALWGLLHDVGEAYLPDVVRPIKHRLPLLVDAEEEILRAVADWIGLAWDQAGGGIPAEVQQADLLALATEARDLMPTGPTPWDSLRGITPWPVRIRPWAPAEAKARFLEAFDQLVLDRDNAKARRREEETANQ